MTTTRDDASRAAIEASARRRWLIGLCITVMFGGFGAVMAWLAYVDREAAPAAPASTPSADPDDGPRDTPPGPGKGKRDK